MQKKNQNQRQLIETNSLHDSIERDSEVNWTPFESVVVILPLGGGGDGISQNFVDHSQKKKKKKKKLGILKLTYKFWRCYSFFGTNYTTTFATFVIGTGYTTTFRTAGD